VLRIPILLRTFAFVLAIAMLGVPIAKAEKTPDPAPGPVPIQLIKGRKAFVSYQESDADPGAPNLTYNEFYALMKSWGKYELAAAPADADLIFEIRYISGITDSQLRLSIVDPRTHVVLWPFVQHVQGSAREKGRRKNFDSAMSDLVDDVKRVTTASAP
jgi:hypothetical protein